MQRQYRDLLIFQAVGGNLAAFAIEDKARHLVENFFARLKQYRAIATRYDKTDPNFLAAIYAAAAIISLN